jgi:hypothetical protein
LTLILLLLLTLLLTLTGKGKPFSCAENCGVPSKFAEELHN